MQVVLKLHFFFFDLTDGGPLSLSVHVDLSL